METLEFNTPYFMAALSCVSSSVVLFVVRS